MSSIPTSAPIPTQPWEAARARFLAGLDDADRKLFEGATLENLFYGASAAFKRFESTSKLRAVQRKLKPLIEGIEGYGKALDTLTQTSSLFLCPIWGSIRVVLHVCTTSVPSFFG